MESPADTHTGTFPPLSLVGPIQTSPGTSKPKDRRVGLGTGDRGPDGGRRRSPVLGPRAPPLVRIVRLPVLGGGRGQTRRTDAYVGVVSPVARRSRAGREVVEVACHGLVETLSGLGRVTVWSGVRVGVVTTEDPRFSRVGTSAKELCVF